MKRAAEFLVGGAIVYVAMAAQAAGCGGSEGGPDAGPLGAGGEGVAGALGGAPGGGFGGAPGTPSGGSGGAGGMVATMGAGPGGGGGKGGSGPVPDADAATPGTRLKPKVFVGADGSRQPTQLWHDTQRNEECSFQRASDGVYRCLPTSMGASYGFFQDSGCTTPALAVASACSGSSLPAYANANGLPGCGESRVYQRGPVLSNAYGGQPGACSPYSPGYYTFYSLSEVPPSQFAAAELRVE